MEYRLSVRTPLTMRIVIYFNGLGLLQARSLDIGRHGIFVHTRQISLPLHAKVDVAFPFDREGKIRDSPLRRIPAMVVRLAAEGVGLMFSKEISAEDI